MIHKALLKFMKTLSHKNWSHMVAITSYIEGNFTKLTTKTYLLKKIGGICSFVWLSPINEERDHETTESRALIIC